MLVQRFASTSAPATQTVCRGALMDQCRWGRRLDLFVYQRLRNVRLQSRLSTSRLEPLERIQREQRITEAAFEKISLRYPSSKVALPEHGLIRPRYSGDFESGRLFAHFLCAAWLQLLFLPGSLPFPLDRMQVIHVQERLRRCRVLNSAVFSQHLNDRLYCAKHHIGIFRVRAVQRVIAPL